MTRALTNILSLSSKVFPNAYYHTGARPTPRSIIFFMNFWNNMAAFLHAMSHEEHHIFAISFRTGKRESNCEAWVPLESY